MNPFDTYYVQGSIPSGTGQALWTMLGCEACNIMAETSFFSFYRYTICSQYFPTFGINHVGHCLAHILIHLPRMEQFLQPGSRWALRLGLDGPHGESRGVRGFRGAGLCGEGQRATLGQWHGVTDGVDSSALELGHRAHWSDLCHGGNGRHCRWNQGGLQSSLVIWMWRSQNECGELWFIELDETIGVSLCNRIIISRSKGICCKCVFYFLTRTLGNTFILSLTQNFNEF